MKKGSKCECINIYLGATFDASMLSIDTGKFELNRSVADTHLGGQILIMDWFIMLISEVAALLVVLNGY